MLIHPLENATPMLFAQAFMTSQMPNPKLANHRPMFLITAQIAAPKFPNHKPTFLITSHAAMPQLAIQSPMFLNKAPSHHIAPVISSVKITNKTIRAIIQMIIHIKGQAKSAALRPCCAAAAANVALACVASAFAFAIAAAV